MIPREAVIVSWENLYQPTPRLLKAGFRIINASWQPTYLVSSLSKRWGPEDLLNWNVYNWQHFWSGSKAYENPINVEPTDRVLGAQISAWESTHEEDIGKILESLSTMSERVWNVDLHHTADDFILKMNVTVHRIARLING